MERTRRISTGMSISHEDTKARRPNLRACNKPLNEAEHDSTTPTVSVATSALVRTYSRRAANACRSAATGVHDCPILGKRGHSLLRVASGSESCLPTRGARSEGWPAAPVFSCRVLRRRVTISLTSFLFTLIVGGPKMAASSSAPRKTTTQLRRRLQLFAKQTARPTFRTGLNGGFAMALAGLLAALTVAVVIVWLVTRRGGKWPRG